MTLLADIRRPLELFAEAVSGLPLELDDRPDACTDDDRIALPGVIDHFAVPDHNRRAYRLAVLREVEQRATGAVTFECLECARVVILDTRGPRDRNLRRVITAGDDTVEHCGTNGPFNPPAITIGMQ